jgi:hypothetical protein
MNMDFVNAWLLYSIKTTDNNGSTIYDIIGAADCSNHAIIMFEEINNGLIELKKRNLIIEKNKIIFPTELFNNWWDNKYKNKQRIYVQKILEDLEKYIKKIQTMDLEIKIEITEEDYKEALNKYKNNN